MTDNELTELQRLLTKAGIGKTFVDVFNGDQCVFNNAEGAGTDMIFVATTNGKPKTIARCASALLNHGASMIDEILRLRAQVREYELAGLGVQALVAEIEENKRTLQWKTHTKDVVILSDSNNNDWARISRTAWGWRMFVFEMPIGTNSSKLEAMCRVNGVMRKMGIVRDFDTIIRPEEKP